MNYTEGAETKLCERCILKKDSVERNQQSDNKINTDEQIDKNRIIMRNRPRRDQTKTACPSVLTVLDWLHTCTPTVSIAVRCIRTVEDVCFNGTQNKFAKPFRHIARSVLGLLQNVINRLLPGSPETACN